jgi:hypothetical protein
MKQGLAALDIITDKVLAYGPSKKNLGKPAKTTKKSAKKRRKRRSTP